MRWYIKKLIFYWKAFFKSKLKKPVTQCPMAKSKNNIFDDENIQKAYKNSKMSSKKKFLSDLVIKQVNLLVFMTMLWIFSANWCFQKYLGSELTLRWSDTPWCIFDILSSFWVQWDTLALWHIITRFLQKRPFSNWAPPSSPLLPLFLVQFCCSLVFYLLNPRFSPPSSDYCSSLFPDLLVWRRWQG